jgi:hypothetical protein
VAGAVEGLVLLGEMEADVTVHRFAKAFDKLRMTDLELEIVIYLSQWKFY